MAPEIVVTESLTKRYGDTTALTDCNLTVARGEIFGLLGPNGSGKTTLLRLLMGFLRPSSGSARIDGLDCYRQAVAVRSRVAYLPGEARLFRHMRGPEALRLLVSLRPDADLQRALDLVDRFQLKLAGRISAFSTGMRQKLALAATLSTSAALIILDEPTANLDPTARSEVLQVTREARQRGQTVIFSSHVLEEIELTCDRVAILRSGSIVHYQEIAALRKQHIIRGRLNGEAPSAPELLAREVSICHESDGEVVIHAPGDLSPLLGWLATLPLSEVRMAPVGLRTVYEQFHSVGQP